MTIEQVHLLDKIELESDTLKAGVSADVQMDYKISLFFDCIEDETKSGQANITDNYVETNYAIQDHIALTPKTYRLKGYVGELVYFRPTDYKAQSEAKFSEIVNAKRTMDKLQSIYGKASALFPTVANYTKTAMNVVGAVKTSYERYQKILVTQKNQILGNTATATKKPLEGIRQNTCNNILFHLMDNRVALSIKGLQFERLQGKDYDSQYFIQSVQAHQGENNFISDFEIVLKELRTVTSQTTTIDKKQLEEANAVQTTNVAINGKATNQKIPEKYISTWEDSKRAEYLRQKIKDNSAFHPVRDFGNVIKQYYKDNFVTDRNSPVVSAITVR